MVSRHRRLSDEELLRLTPRRPAEFGTFYDRHSVDVLVFFRRRTREPDAALDLMAETFARALEGAERFEPGRGPNARAWLFGIAHHVLADARRHERVSDSARRRLGMEPIALDDDGYARIESLASGIALDEALRALPHDQQRALTARVVEERAYADIAADLACSDSVVRKRVSRALATLRTRLEEKPR